VNKVGDSLNNIIKMFRISKLIEELNNQKLEYSVVLLSILRRGKQFFDNILMSHQLSIIYSFIIFINCDILNFFNKLMDCMFNLN
jgi:hypothetical protein